MGVPFDEHLVLYISHDLPNYTPKTSIKLCSLKLKLKVEKKKKNCQFGCHFLIYEFILTFSENLKKPENGDPELQRHHAADVQHSFAPG